MPRYDTTQDEWMPPTMTPHVSRSPRQPVHVSHKSFGDHSVDHRECEELLVLPFGEANTRPETGSILSESSKNGESALWIEDSGPTDKSSRSSSSEVGIRKYQIQFSNATSADQSIVGAGLHIVRQHPDLDSLYGSLTASDRLRGCTLEIADSLHVPHRWCLSWSDIRRGQVAIRVPSRLPVEALVPSLVLEMLNLSNQYSSVCQVVEMHDVTGTPHGTCRECKRRIRTLLTQQQARVDEIIHSGIEQYGWSPTIQQFSFAAMRDAGLWAAYIDEYAEYACDKCSEFASNTLAFEPL